MIFAMWTLPKETTVHQLAQTVTAPSGGPVGAPEPIGSISGGGAPQASIGSVNGGGTPQATPSDGGKSLMKSVGFYRVLLLGGLGFMF
ncbi:hypothetical protein Ancab_035604 [Ancistrocladus abbreviatus]